jgi:uncharacterized protein (DUF433 family)
MDQEVRESRIVIRADDTSYINYVGVYVSTILAQLSNDVSYQALIDRYPGLMEKDIHTCVKFEIVRNRGLL